MKRSLTIAATVLVALALAAGALAAGGSILGGYGGEGGSLVNKVAASPQGNSAQGTLPFTGLDLGVAAGGAMLLVLSGVTLRRAARKKT